MNGKVGKHLGANRDRFSEKNLLLQTRISRYRATRSMELSCESVHWIERVEFYLENEFEIWIAFLSESRQVLFKKLLFQTRITRLRATTSKKLSCECVHWIELVEFYLENEWESWKAFVGESWQVFWKTCYLKSGFRDLEPLGAWNWVFMMSTGWSSPRSILKMNGKVGKHSRANRDRFSEKPAVSDQDFAV